MSYLFITFVLLVAMEWMGCGLWTEGWVRFHWVDGRMDGRDGRDTLVILFHFPPSCSWVCFFTQWVIHDDTIRSFKGHVSFVYIMSCAFGGWRVCSLGTLIIGIFIFIIILELNMDLGRSSMGSGCLGHGEAVGPAVYNYVCHRWFGLSVVQDQAEDLFITRRHE